AESKTRSMLTPWFGYSRATRSRTSSPFAGSNTGDRIAAMSDGGHTADSDLFHEVVREPNLSDKVAASITEAIVSGRLKPDERLQSERELGERFGVSR